MLIGGFRRTKKGKQDIMEIPCLVDECLLPVRTDWHPDGQKVSGRRQTVGVVHSSRSARIAFSRSCLPLCPNGAILHRLV